MPDDDKGLDYFPFYFWDFEAATEHLSNGAKMGYIRVLAHLYKNNGFLEDDIDLLRKYARVSGRGTREIMEQIYNLLDRCIKINQNSIIYVDRLSQLDLQQYADKKIWLTQKKALKQIQKIKHIQAVNEARAKKAAARRWRK